MEHPVHAHTKKSLAFKATISYINLFWKTDTYILSVNFVFHWELNLQ